MAPQSDHDKYIITSNVITSGHKIQPSLESNPAKNGAKVSNAHAYNANLISSNDIDNVDKEFMYTYLDGLKFAKTYVLPDRELRNNRKRLRNKGKRRRRKNYYKNYDKNINVSEESLTGRRRKREKYGKNREKSSENNKVYNNRRRKQNKNRYKNKNRRRMREKYRNKNHSR